MVSIACRSNRKLTRPNFSYIRQREPTGLVDALRMARPLIGNDPFAVILPDQLFDGERSALSQLLDVFNEQRLSVVGAERVRPDVRDGSHVIGADLHTSAIKAARALVRVPPIDAAFDSFAIAGRFVFTPAAWSAFEYVANARSGDSSLVNAIRNLMERERVFACLFDGRRFDCGTKLGYLEAQVAFARKRPDLWDELRRSFDDFITTIAACPREDSPSRRRCRLTVASNGCPGVRTDRRPQRNYREFLPTLAWSLRGNLWIRIGFADGTSIAIVSDRPPSNRRPPQAS